MGGVLEGIFFKNKEEELGPPQFRNLEEIMTKDIDGKEVRIGDYLADKKVVMFVNVATK